MANLTEIRTSSGYILRVRRVPAWYLMAAAASVPLPEPPYEEIQTVGGVVERRPARQGTPAYEAYVRELAEATRRREAQQIAAAVSAAVVEWSEDGKEWRREPPENWTLPEVFSISSTGNPRADYILHELLVTAEDLDSVVSAAAVSVREQEVEEAKRLF